MRIDLERHLEESLCQYPELIDDSLKGIRQGMAEALGSHVSSLKRQDCMPNGRLADMVFVEPVRVTVIEIKRGRLSVSDQEGEEDVVDQIVNYLDQCRVKYPDRTEYRGFIVGTGIVNHSALITKLSSAPFEIIPLVFGRDIPSVVTICSQCGRATKYGSARCRCGVDLPV